VVVVDVLGGGGCCGGVVVVVVVVDFFFVVEVVVEVDDEGPDELVGVVVEVPDTEVLLPSSVVWSWTWTESWLVRSGAASSFGPASMATVANAVDTTTPATPSAMYGVRRSRPPSSGGGASPI
jgi:hypothetical protein